MFKEVKKNLNMVRRHTQYYNRNKSKERGGKEKSRRMRMRRRKVEVGG